MEKASRLDSESVLGRCQNEVFQGDLQAMGRAVVFEMLGLCGDVETQEEARKLFAKHLQGVLVPADLRVAVYSTVLIEADEITLEKFIKMHDSCDLKEEQKRILGSLGRVKDSRLIQKILDYAISVRPQS
jgi:hypothetical protein